MKKLRKFSGKPEKIRKKIENIVDNSFTKSHLARLAVYDSLLSSPRIIDFSSSDILEFINQLSTETYKEAQNLGGKVPYTVIRELVENLIHAYFKEAVISVLDNGNTIRISDLGPGIKDKEKAFLPGFTTATKELKKYIRGVGSGLPIVKETLSFLGGEIFIEDNLGSGTVITITFPNNKSSKEILKEKDTKIELSEIQKKILFLLAEIEKAGPSLISKELKISISTAFRELENLEKFHLITNEDGKRKLTEKGINTLESLFKGG
jgi:predicted transcriptional regulator